MLLVTHTCHAHALWLWLAMLLCIFEVSLFEAASKGDGIGEFFRVLKRGHGLRTRDYGDEIDWKRKKLKSGVTIRNEEEESRNAKQEGFYFGIGRRINSCLAPAEFERQLLDNLEHSRLLALQPFLCLLAYARLACEIIKSVRLSCKIRHYITSGCCC